MTESTLPAALETFYRSHAANENIKLLTGTIDVSKESRAWRGPGYLALTWSPTPGVRWFMTAENVPPTEWITGDVRIQMDGLDGPASGRIESIRSQDGAKKEVSGLVLEPLETGTPKNLHSLAFHLLNLPHLGGAPIRYATSNTVSSCRLTFSTSRYCITLDEIEPEPFELGLFGYVDAPRIHDGFVLTNVGQIRRIDDSAFTFKDAVPALDLLALLLSFARGAPTPPVLLSGKDANGRVIWTRWDASPIAGFRPYPTWCVPAEPKIEGLLAELEQLVLSAPWSQMLPRLIGWYTDALAQPRPGGTIVLAQIALEAFAWSYCVQSASLLTEEGFEKLSAADKFRLVLGSLGVAPSRTPIFKDTSGPELVTWTRNSLVHGNKTVPDEQAIAEGTNAALTYLELCLLRLLRHTGLYQNRLDGMREHWVPWSTLGKGSFQWSPVSAQDDETQS